MDAHVARPLPRTHVLDGQCSHAERRDISPIDDGRQPENVFGASVAWQDVLKRAAREAMDALLGHDWPGNVRELRNVLERATILCEDGSITREDLSLLPASPAHVDSTDLEVIERRTIERVMREANGNKAQASRRLGISRMQLYGRLRKYGLEAPGAPAVERLFTDGSHGAVT